MALLSSTAAGQTAGKGDAAKPQDAAIARNPVQEKYGELLEKLKKGERTVDFKELRLSYTETKEYSPYGNDRDARKAMFAAMNSKDWDEALKQSAKILDKNYVDLNGHFGAYVAHREKGDADKADFHKFVFQGLIDSILKPGDGKSTEKALVVISTDEEYVILNFLGLRPAGQALLNVEGHSYDKMTAVDPKTNETFEFYFNIDKPFGRLGSSLKK